MKNIKLYIIILVVGIAFTACSSDDNSTTEVADVTAPAVVSTYPKNGDTGISNVDSVIITYNDSIYLPPQTTIKINNAYVDSLVYAKGKQLIIKYATKGNTNYKVTISKPSVRDSLMNFASDYEFSFSTQSYNEFDSTAFMIANTPVNINATEATKKLYTFLKDNFGKKMISAAMANPSLNTQMADTIYAKTGKYPAINCFDFVHHIYSSPLNPSNWIDYTNTSVEENWWKNGGIVAFMWHWNVPINKYYIKNFDKYTFRVNSTEANTSFDAAEATVDGTWEKQIVDRDLEIVANYLLALQNKGIPVIWRPLHEGSGNIYNYADGKPWFWWGNGGSSNEEHAEAYKKLWVYMFNYFKNKGVNNLIWVWTSEGNDAAFYPGDNYVDIIGRDYYESTASLYHASLIDKWKELLKISNKKIFTLAECGAIPSIDNTRQNGDMWSWFMPWYGDYTDDGVYNAADFFSTQMNSNYVITRDKVSGLK